jgi:hypothetical protein
MNIEVKYNIVYENYSLIKDVNFYIDIKEKIAVRFAMTEKNELLLVMT